MVPSFEVIYSGNDFVSVLLKCQAEVLRPKFSKKKIYNGTYIRKLMTNSNRWREYVPNSVVEVIEKIDGINRVRFLYKEMLFEEKKTKLVK
jgi:nicotinamide-nucleotide adenylyltransferase